MRRRRRRDRLVVVSEWLGLVVWLEVGAWALMRAEEVVCLLLD